MAERWCRSKEDMTSLMDKDMPEKMSLKMSPINLVIGYGENLGSGFPMIMSAWKNAGWGEPVLENKVDIDEVELVLPLQEAHAKQNGENISGSPLSDKSQKTQQKKRNVTKDVTKDVTNELSGRQHIILEMIRINPLVTISEMSLKAGVVIRTIKRDLEKLQQMRVLIREGGRKEGRWVILSSQEDGNM